MKKTIFFAAVASFFLFTVGLSAQSKYLIKEAKKTAKQLEKDGYQTRGGHKSIEAYLVSYYMLEEENELLQGRSGGVRNNDKVAQSLAKQNALREYVQMNTSYFKGKGAELEGTLGGETINDITNAAVSKFGGFVDGKVSVSFVLFKTEADGTTSAIAYCYVSKKSADEARKEAMQDAIEDVDMVKIHQDKVNEILND